MNVLVRPARPAEIGHLAAVWHDGWHEAHAQIVPAELTQLRTMDSFRIRLLKALSDIRVVGAVDAPVGFCMVKEAELYQLYVSTQSRGSGVAAALIAEGESRLREGGVITAWLACAIGNERAAKFYEKCGWCFVGTMDDQVETSVGKFPLKVWRYEKRLAPHHPSQSETNSRV
ncbi:MAG TPA: GNAT family N-acetyltransferase [Steroidobacteraceae bacterium]|jgi:ribosomal protein S18 acetylase RimI-like enzyme